MKAQGSLENSFISAFIGGVVVFVALLVILPRIPQITAPVILGALKDDPQTLAQILDMARKAQQQLDDKQLLEGVKLTPDALLDTRYAIVKNGANFSPEQAIYLVEFGDYFCAVCKDAHQEVGTMLREESDLQWIYHHLAIMDPLSTHAAVRVMSAGEQATALHNRLFTVRGQLNRELINSSSEALDLPEASQETLAQLHQVVQNNQTLAVKLGVIGTPAFVLMAKNSAGNWVIDAMAGWPPVASVQQRLAKLRNEL